MGPWQRREDYHCNREGIAAMSLSGSSRVSQKGFSFNKAKKNQVYGQWDERWHDWMVDLRPPYTLFYSEASIYSGEALKEKL